MKLIKLGKPDCVPCSNVAKFLQDNNASYTEIDIYESSKEVSKYNITGVPVTILLDDYGNEIERANGFNPPMLVRLINQL